ncbi:Dak phosphatase [Acephala macrosclerotiorum]|nr:Dak phosphatase [Acephala macrosclerotiorum]
MRPSTKTVETSSGQTIVLDPTLSKSKDVLIAVIGSVGNFSSKILSESHLAAFTAEQFGRPVVSASEIGKILKENGFPTENGLIVVRSSSRQDLKVHAESKVLEFVVVGELKLDHILSLLLATKPNVKASFEKTRVLLEHFVKSAARTNSAFHEKKTGNGLSVIHAVETAEFSSAKRSIDKDLGHLLSSRPPRGDDLVYSVHYSDVNGLSRLENNILAHEVSEYFAKKNLPLYLTQSTILDSHSQARGWSISFCAIPSEYLTHKPKPTNPLANTASITTTSKRSGTSKIQLTDSQVRKIIIAGCDRVIKEEPAITEYDTIVGDGDCGYTLRDGAKQVLSFIKDADLSTLPSTLSSLVDDLEVNMGGTSGALYCIFLSSLSQELYEAPTFADALKGALDSLLMYTRARLGDRTCLDCLIPFVETLKESGEAKSALAAAEKGVESTKKLEAKLGRSSYLDESATRGVPDPGAYGLSMLLEGMVNA